MSAFVSCMAQTLGKETKFDLKGENIRAAKKHSPVKMLPQLPPPSLKVTCRIRAQFCSSSQEKFENLR